MTGSRGQAAEGAQEAVLGGCRVLRAPVRMVLSLLKWSQNGPNSLKIVPKWSKKWFQ